MLFILYCGTIITIHTTRNIKFLLYPEISHHEKSFSVHCKLTFKAEHKLFISKMSLCKCSTELLSSILASGEDFRIQAISCSKFSIIEICNLFASCVSMLWMISFTMVPHMLACSSSRTTSCLSWLIRLDRTLPSCHYC